MIAIVDPGVISWAIEPTVKCLLRCSGGEAGSEWVVNTEVVALIGAIRACSAD
jgi:hypothetical protein